VHEFLSFMLGSAARVTIAIQMEHGAIKATRTSRRATGPSSKRPRTGAMGCRKPHIAVSSGSGRACPLLPERRHNDQCTAMRRARRLDRP
jgi:hypothetical protein